jgi:hypothetical protein
LWFFLVIRSPSNEWPSGGDSKSEETTPYFNANVSSYTYSFNNSSQNFTANNTLNNNYTNITSTPKIFINSGSTSNNSIQNQSITNFINTGSSRKKDKYKQPIENEEISKETIHVYDGDSSLRKRIFRTIIVPQNCTYKILLDAALRTFHINDDPNKYFITIPIIKYTTQQHLFEDTQIEEKNINEDNPIKSIKKIFIDEDQLKNKTAIMLRYIDETDESIRIFSRTFK